MIRRPTDRLVVRYPGAHPVQADPWQLVRSGLTRAPPVRASVLACSSPTQPIACDGKRLVCPANVADRPASRSTRRSSRQCDDAFFPTMDDPTPCGGALWIVTMGRKAEKGAGASTVFIHGELLGSTTTAGITIRNVHMLPFADGGNPPFFTDSP